MARPSPAARSAPRAARAATSKPPSAARRRARPLEQLALELGPAQPRWSFSRRVLASPHRARICERLEFVRRFYPELDRTTVRVGMALKRGVLGWGSLDPERPGVWVRPRRLDTFTIAHELTHLLQARGEVPHGERACDLWALARSPLLVDSPPGYLRLPHALARRRRLTPRDAAFLSGIARAAVAARAAGDRRYLARFEREVAQRYGTRAPRSPRRGR
ncbi:MAG TPA: hypothetical protein VGK89_03020 [Candidatus Eisenbacteria bacterium]